MARQPLRPHRFSLACRSGADEPLIAMHTFILLRLWRGRKRLAAARTQPPAASRAWMSLQIWPVALEGE